MDRGETLQQAVVRVREAGGAFTAPEVLAVLQDEEARAAVRGPTDRPEKCKLKGAKRLRLERVWLDRSQ